MLGSVWKSLNLIRNSQLDSEERHFLRNRGRVNSTYLLVVVMHAVQSSSPRIMLIDPFLWFTTTFTTKDHFLSFVGGWLKKCLQLLIEVFIEYLRVGDETKRHFEPLIFSDMLTFNGAYPRIGLLALLLWRITFKKVSFIKIADMMLSLIHEFGYHCRRRLVLVRCNSQ